MRTFKIYSLSNFRISNTAIWGGGTPQHKILHRGLGWNPSPGRDRSHRSDNTRPLTCPRTATGEPLHYDQQAACYSPRDSFIYYPAFIFLHGVEKVLDAKWHKVNISGWHGRRHSTFYCFHCCSFKGLGIIFVYGSFLKWKEEFREIKIKDSKQFHWV